MANATTEEQRPLVRLVDRILAAKGAHPDVDTGELEEELDWLVYDLYSLSNKEITTVADDFRQAS